jgi:N-acetylmuramoyl-L-alanine amidase
MTAQSIADIHTIVIHCSATKEGVWVDASDIDEWHKARGWSGIGYAWVVRLDGTREPGRAMAERGAHVKGNNTNTIGVCMIGGLDEDGNPKDTFTDLQYEGLFELLFTLKAQLPGLKRIVGHRDYSPDLNGDGLITPDEWIKDCPCWETRDRLPEWGLAQYMIAPNIEAT